MRFRNFGIGPLIVDKLLVTQGNESKTALIDFMPNLPDGVHWTTFVGDISGRAVSSDKEVILVSLGGDANDRKFVAARQLVRKALSGLTIEVTYKNVYGEQMPSAQRSLDWFGRNC